MKELKHDTDATPAEVWTVLSNGWLYASWVVGASRIRNVEGAWPAVGAKIHHSVGSWPVLLNDETQVQASEAGRLLRLTARTRPFGESVVEIELVAREGGTTMIMREEMVSGPMGSIPKPIQGLTLGPRNRESLRRLAFLAEGGAS